jgi:hypothetical protein
MSLFDDLVDYGDPQDAPPDAVEGVAGQNGGQEAASSRCLYDVEPPRPTAAVQRVGVLGPAAATDPAVHATMIRQLLSSGVPGFDPFAIPYD